MWIEDEKDIEKLSVTYKYRLQPRDESVGYMADSWEVEIINVFLINDFLDKTIEISDELTPDETWKIEEYLREHLGKH